MSVQTYAVSSASPIAIFPSGLQLSQLIRNTSTANHVFLSNLASGTGFDLGPGSSISWDAGNPLFASVTAGLPVTLSVLDSGGPLFDASAIAAQISVSGAPPIDVNDTIVDTTFVGGRTLPNSTPFFYDTSKYQSITVIVYEANTVPPVVPVPRFHRLSWYGVATGGISGPENYIEDFVSIDNDNSGTTYSTYYRTSVKSGMLRISVNSNTQTTTSIRVIVIGSYKTLIKPSYLCRSGYWGGLGTGVDNLQMYNFGAGTLAATTVLYPQIKGGNSVMSVYVASVATFPLEVYLYDTNNFIITAFVFPILTTPQAQARSIIIPNQPCRIGIKGSGAVVAGLQISLGYVE